MKKILLIEDDPFVVDFIRKGLVEEGFEVAVAIKAEDGLEKISVDQFDLVILDIMLPDKNGLELCGEIRGMGIKTPVLCLTALGAAENIALGLNSGADDYLVKPFKFIVLLARINALLRRVDNNQDFARPGPQIEIFTVGDLRVDDKAKTVLRANTPVNLTATEYRLLMTLIKNKGRVLSRMDLLEMAWDINFNSGTNVVDVYINYLRKKIDGGHTIKLIHTIIGMGYVLRES